jgi:type IV pilus assembly protein PilP
MRAHRAGSMVDMLLSLLAACTTDPVVSTPPPPPPSPEPRVTDPLDAVIAAQEGYTYNPIGRPDPFRSMTCDDCSERTRRDDYPLESLTLRGVVWGGDAPQALVVDPAGGSRVLSVGSYVGDSWGKVVSIGAGGVRIVEEYMTLDGNLVVIPRTLTLP